MGLEALQIGRCYKMAGRLKVVSYKMALDFGGTRALRPAFPKWKFQRGLYIYIFILYMFKKRSWRWALFQHQGTQPTCTRRRHSRDQIPVTVALESLDRRILKSSPSLTKSCTILHLGMRSLQDWDGLECQRLRCCRIVHLDALQCIAIHVSRV